MFCGKCGAKNPDEAVVCVECGAPLGAAPKSAAPVAPARVSRNHRLVGIGAAAAAVVVVAILLISIFGGRGYKATVKKYFDSSMTADAKGIISVIPKKVVNKALEDYDSRSEAIEKLGDTLQRTLDRAYGDGKLEYTITFIDTEDITGDELRELKKDYAEDYDLKIKAAKEVDIKIKVTLDGNEGSQTITVPLVKVGGSWYIDVENFGRIF